VVAVVAVAAGWQSYTHICALAIMTGQSVTDARLLPVAVDGLIVAGSVILLAGSPLGWLGVIPGIAATVFGNVMSAVPHGALAAAVAAWPAAAFTLASFMLERWLKRRARRTNPGAPEMPPDPAVIRAALNGQAAKAEKLFAADLADGRVPGIRRIMTGMKVGDEKAKLIQQHLRNSGGSDA